MFKFERPWGGLGYLFDKDDEDDDDGLSGGGARASRSPEIIKAKYGGNETQMAIHIGDLEEENYKYRQKLRDTKSELKEAKEQVPAEGSVVLSKEEAEAYEAYKELGKPEDLKKKLADVDEVKKKIQVSEHESLLSKIAKDTGFDLDVFKDLDGRSEGLTYEVKELLKEDGTKVPTWSVKYKEDGVTREREVGEYYKDKFPKYMDLLANGTGDSSSDTGDTTNGGVPFPAQRTGGGRKKAPSAAKSVLETVYKAGDDKKE